MQESALRAHQHLRCRAIPGHVRVVTLLGPGPNEYKVHILQFKMTFEVVKFMFLIEYIKHVKGVDYSYVFLSTIRVILVQVLLPWKRIVA